MLMAEEKAFLFINAFAIFCDILTRFVDFFGFNREKRKQDNKHCCTADIYGCLERAKKWEIVRFLRKVWIMLPLFTKFLAFVFWTVLAIHDIL